MMQEGDWRTAEVMAQSWAERGTDPNEVSKALRYLCDHRDGALFFYYLQTVVKEGSVVVRSGRTLDYYRQIDSVCRRHLASYREDPGRMAQILGWAVRLMRYYQAKPRTQRATPPRPPRRTRSTQPQAGTQSAQRRGTVKWFDMDRRFGFIRPEGGGADVFVHVSGLAQGVSTLVQGQRVEFELGTGRNNRSQAVQVRPLEER